MSSPSSLRLGDVDGGRAPRQLGVARAVASTMARCSLLRARAQRRARRLGQRVKIRTRFCCDQTWPSRFIGSRCCTAHTGARGRRGSARTRCCRSDRAARSIASSRLRTTRDVGARRPHRGAAARGSSTSRPCRPAAGVRAEPRLPRAALYAVPQRAPDEPARPGLVAGQRAADLHPLRPGGARAARAHAGAAPRDAWRRSAPATPSARGSSSASTSPRRTRPRRD